MLPSLPSLLLLLLLPTSTPPSPLPWNMAFSSKEASVAARALRSASVADCAAMKVRSSTNSFLRWSSSIMRFCATMRGWITSL